MSANPYNDDKRLIELLERWQSGDFTRADEQELLALADSDAFRRETVEGFWAMPEADHAARLAALKTRLGHSNHKARRFNLIPIMAAAAVLLLIVAVVWLIPSVEQSATLAEEKTLQTQDSQGISSDAVMNAPAPAPQENPAADQALLQDSKAKKLLPPAPPASSRQAAPSVSPAGAASDDIAAWSSKQEAKMADKMASPEPVVAEQVQGQNARELEDVDTQPGNSAKPTRAPSVEKPVDAAKRKQAASETNASIPAGGWEKFQNYLRKNARLPETARQNNISGSVRLTFRLDPNNQPIDIQIIRSLGFGCDEEAIRLVKAYSWQRGSDPNLTLDIPFVR